MNAGLMLIHPIINPPFFSLQQIADPENVWTLTPCSRAVHLGYYKNTKIKNHFLYIQASSKFMTRLVLV